MCWAGMNFLYDSIKDSEVRPRMKTWLFVHGSKSGRGRFRNFFFSKYNRTKKCQN